MKEWQLGKSPELAQGFLEHRYSVFLSASPEAREDCQAWQDSPEADQEMVPFLPPWEEAFLWVEVLSGFRHAGVAWKGSAARN